MSPIARAQFQIHFCVLLWGFTAILGKLITLPALPLVWWRMLIVVGTLLLLPRVWHGLRSMPLRFAATYSGIGAVIALHWLAFYGAVKLANASVAASCIALSPVFLALVEPYLVGRRFNPRELLLAVAVVPGVVLVVGGVPGSMHTGVAVGALSAALIAVGSALNKRFIEHGEPLVVTCLELGAGVVALTAITPLVSSGAAVFSPPGPRDALLLAVLALGCTLLPFALSLVALRHLSAFATQLAVNLEPVYAIVIAALLLGEQRELHAMFYLGVAIILAAVFAHPFLVGRLPTQIRDDLPSALPHSSSRRERVAARRAQVQ
jgi:drug/metabolite transporter (DMT)-like permease